MKAPKLVKTKKANSRFQSQKQVGKCNFSEIPTGVVSLMKVVFLSIVKRAISFTKKDYKNIPTHFTTLCDIFDPSIA